MSLERRKMSSDHSDAQPLERTSHTKNSRASLIIKTTEMSQRPLIFYSLQISLNKVFPSTTSDNLKQETKSDLCSRKSDTVIKLVNLMLFITGLKNSLRALMTAYVSETSKLPFLNFIRSSDYVL